MTMTLTMNFPPELLVTIAEILPSRDVKSLRLSCRLYRDLLKPILFRRVRISDHHAFSPQDLVNASKLARKTTHLSLTQKTRFGGDPNPVYQQIASCFPCLTSLNIQILGVDRILEDLRQLCLDIQNLALDTVKMRLQSAAISALFLPGLDDDDPIISLPALETFEVTWMVGSTAWDAMFYIQSLIAKSTLNLSSLSICVDCNLDEFADRDILREEPLAISGFLMSHVEAIKNLAHLTIEGSWAYIYIDDMASVVDSLCKLSKLRTVTLVTEFGDREDYTFISDLFGYTHKLSESCKHLQVCFWQHYTDPWESRSDPLWCEMHVHRESTGATVHIVHNSEWMPVDLLMSMGSEMVLTSDAYGCIPYENPKERQEDWP